MASNTIIRDQWPVLTAQRNDNTNNPWTAEVRRPPPLQTLNVRVPEINMATVLSSTLLEDRAIPRNVLDGLQTQIENQLTQEMRDRGNNLMRNSLEDLRRHIGSSDRMTNRLADSAEYIGRIDGITAAGASVNSVNALGGSTVYFDDDRTPENVPTEMERLRRLMAGNTYNLNNDLARQESVFNSAHIDHMRRSIGADSSSITESMLKTFLKENLSISINFTQTQRTVEVTATLKLNSEEISSDTSFIELDLNDDHE